MVDYVTNTVNMFNVHHFLQLSPTIYFFLQKRRFSKIRVCTSVADSNELYFRQVRIVDAIPCFACYALPTPLIFDLFKLDIGVDFDLFQVYRFN